MARRNSLVLSAEDVDRHNARIRKGRFTYGGVVGGGKTAAMEAAMAGYTAKNPGVTVARIRGDQCIIEKPAGAGSIVDVRGGAALKAIAGKPARDAMKRRAKYGNEPEIVDGIRMPSKKEAKRYRELGLLMKAGQINMLARQVRFALPGGIEYVADFVYGDIERPIGPVLLTVEDCKGVRTEGYKLKKKLMDATYGIVIVET